ncbi:MAG: ChaN family lipoprotein, partial [Luteimonas sp.]
TRLASRPALPALFAACMGLAATHANAGVDAPAIVPAPPGPAQPLLSFQATGLADNALVGHFWSPSTQQFLDLKAVFEQLPEGGWMMIGESHDHPDHHRFEVLMVSFLAHVGRLGNIALEVVSGEQQEAFDRWLGRGDDASGDDLSWDPQRWSWMDYRDLVAMSLNAAPRVIAGDLSQEQRARALADGPPRGEHSPAHSSFLGELIVRSHCGHGTPEAFAPMVNVQLARDQNMAAQMAANTVEGKVNLLVAGSGHVRSDHGAPLWLPADMPRLSIVLQAVGESENPNDYLASHFDGRSAADLVYFVPALPPRDVCVAFAEPEAH